MRRALSRASIALVTTVTLVTAAAGFGYTSTGRAVFTGLNRMAHGGCPFGYDQAMSPAERERARTTFATHHRAERRAAIRPALGFTLDQTTRPQVVARLSSHGVSCAAGRGMSDLTCQRVPSAALDGAAAMGPDRTVWFTFGLKDQLLSVIAVSSDRDARTISNEYLSTRNTLSARAGSATVDTGSAAPDALMQGVLRQASAEYEFSNYYAVQRAANMGNRFVFTEEYRSLAD